MHEIHHGDCREVLKSLSRKYTAIYFDPPFKTEREFRYSSRSGSHGFSDVWGDDRLYEAWLEEVIPACKEKLTEDGSFYFHIGAEQSFIPESVLRRHFKNVEKIFWKRAHGKNTVKRKFGAVVDIIFRASDNKAKFNLLHVALNGYYFEHSYCNRDKKGYYALGALKHDKTRRGYFWTYEKDGVKYEAPYGWKVSEDDFKELLAQDRIHFAKRGNRGRGMLYKKLYKHECKGRPLSNLWDDISYITRTERDKRFYPTQKPVDLLKRIVEISSDKGDWILDPVAGAGTTGVAAVSLGRNVTLIDKNIDACKIMKMRLGGNICEVGTKKASY